MSQKRHIPFEIASIDSLGQGVSKLSDKVTFIPKTCPGDKGEAVVMSEKKGVAFARLKTLHQSSDKRIEPVCPHFSQCYSCHFLHVSYEEELKFKKESFERLFRKLSLPPVEVISAPERLGYRNRIQLHYSLKSKLLGLKDPQTFSIIPVPHCLVGLPPILEELKRLYENNHWLKEAPTGPTEGHVEIYWKDNQLQVSWNRPYAEGGFTQVYEVMNQKLKDKLLTEWRTDKNSQILDLFAGNGNLSSPLPHKERLCVDIYRESKESPFLNQNLYDDGALRNVLREIKRRGMNPDHLLLDPPRSGHKDLKKWVDALNPKFIAYVSCDPHTLARDLKDLENYNFTRSFLIDFFPSTFHFESMIFLERKHEN